MKKPYIICAAVWFNDGVEREHQPINIDKGIVICGRRHHNCIMTMYVLNKKLADDCNEYNGKAIQGFLTSDDRFVNRTTALEIAYDAGQVCSMKDILISDDLY